MTDTMKLLRAFIEASGFDVEEIQEQKIPSGQILTPHDYKVTKKPHQVCFDVNSPEWSSVVLYIIGHRHEIEIKENDFGTLAPMLDCFDRSIKQNKSPD